MSKTGHNVSYATVCKAFDDRKVSDFTDDELLDFVDVLCDDGLRNDEHQVRASLRIAALNHVRMERHITKLDAAARNTQCWFMFLAVMSILAAGVQVVCDVRSELRDTRVGSLSPKVSADSNPAVQDDAQKHETPGSVQQPPSLPPRHE